MTEGRLLNRRYRLEARIGFGGMGAVYRANDELLGRVVAVKELREEYAQDDLIRRRFMREAQAAGRLNHPSVVTIFDFLDEGENSLFIVMEYLDGGTLLDRMNQAESRRVDLWRVLRAGQGALEGLQCAHDLGLVHRDVKPGNLLYDAAGNCKIADFGVVTALTREEEITTLTQVGTHPGTLVYMSPEQIDGAEVDGRSDVYSMAAVLYEAISGVRYFEREGMRRTERALMDAICERPPVSLRHHVPYVPESVERVLTQALSKIVEERPSARELAADIAHIIAARPKPQIVHIDADATRPSIKTDSSWKTKVRLSSEAREEAETLPRALPARAPRPESPPDDEPSTEAPSAASLFAAELNADVTRLTAEDELAGIEDSVPAVALEGTRARPDIQRLLPGSQGEATTRGRRAHRGAGKPRRREIDDAIEIVSAGGTFLMGGGLSSDELPRRDVTIAAFAIDRFPVSVGQYRAFLEAVEGGERPDEVPLLSELYPNGKDHRPQGWGTPEFEVVCPTDEHPIVFVDWFDAAAYAAWAGGRLPTEAEWEFAARGDQDARRFPWGEEPPSPGRAVYGRRGQGPLVLGDRPQGASGLGVEDLAGNVWEWCLDRYDADAYASLPDQDPHLALTGPSARAVKRGGSWTNAPHSLRCAKRGAEKLHIRRNNLGFRCTTSA